MNNNTAIEREREREAIFFQGIVRISMKLQEIENKIKNQKEEGNRRSDDGFY